MKPITIGKNGTNPPGASFLPFLSLPLSFVIPSHLWKSAEEVSGAAIKDLGRELIRSFVELATEAGSIPIIVFFPTRTELSDADSASSRVNPLPFGAEFVRDAGGEAIDLTPCLKEANPSPSFQRGGHYSPQTNTVVAQCLYDELGTRLRVLHINRSKRG